MSMTRMTVWHSPQREFNRFLPEGPRPYRYNGKPGLLWVNIQSSPEKLVGVLYFGPFDGSGMSVFTMPGRIGFVLPTNIPNIVYAGIDKTVGFYKLDERSWHPLETIPDTNPRTIINDGEMLPDGSGVIFGTKDLQFKEPLGHLYLHTFADRKLSVLCDGQTCSNGKVIQGTTLYDIDSPRKTVTQYSLDIINRTLTPAGIALDLRHRDDFPDGMCDCGDGTVIVAFYNPNPREAGQVIRFRLDTGEIVYTWETPGSPRVTCPVIVQHPDGPRLFCTTATEGMPAEQRSVCPNAGSIFVGEIDVTVPEPVVLRIGG